MDIKHIFFEDREAALKAILKSNGKTEEEVKKDIEILRTWLNTQKHLPEIPSEYSKYKVKEIIKIKIFHIWHRYNFCSFKMYVYLRAVISASLQN